MQKNDLYLTATEVADLLKINVETVYQLVRKQELPATRIGSQWRFEAQLIRDWFRIRSTLSGSGNQE